MKPLPKKIPSHPITTVRIPPADKELFKQAAARDGKALGTWLRWLAHRRVDAQREYS